MFQLATTEDAAKQHSAYHKKDLIHQAATWLTLIVLILGPLGLQGQQERLNLVKIHTNAPGCTLNSAKTGRLLATADASGNLRWEPDIIRRKDKRVRIEGLHFIPSTIKIKRRLRLGSVLMSAIEGGLAGIAIGDFTNETGGTSFSGYEDPASTGAAAAFVLGLISNRNYVVAPKSRFMEVSLKYDPAFMNEQWSIVKSSNSKKRVEDFKLAYPEFPSMAAVDELLMSIRFDEVESRLLNEAKNLLANPDNMKGWQSESLNAALREFGTILEDFSSIPAKAEWATRVANMESEAANIRMALKSKDVFEGLMTGVGSAPDGPLDYWRLAGWLKAWEDARPSDRREALAGLANVAKPWAAALKESKVMQETGGAGLMADLTQRLSDCDTSLVGFFNAFNEVHEAASTAATAVDEAHWPRKNNGFSALLDQAWNSYLTSTTLPQVIQEDMVRSFWNNIQHGDGSPWPELNTWAGIMIPESATLEDIMASVESPLLLADLNTPIPLGNPVIANMIPSTLISYDQSWRDMFPSLTEDTLAWVIIGDSLNSRNGFSLGFQSGYSIEVNNFEKPSELMILGSIWDGIYTGTQPSYPMTGKNGRPLIVAGKTVEVPSSRHDISLQGKKISVTQRTSDTKAEMTGTCTVSEGTGITSFQCRLSDEDGTSNPNCSMDLDMATGALSFEWAGEQGPGFMAYNLDFKGNLLPLAQEVWVVRDEQGKIREEMCTDWVDHDESKPFFPNERLDVLTVDQSAVPPKVDIVDNIDILLEAIAKHAGWKSSAGTALTDAQDELAELIINVELALIACEEYEEVGTNLPIPIATSSLKRQRSEWNRHSSRMSEIMDAVQANVDRARLKEEKARKKFYWRVYKAGYIYVEFKDDGSYETYQKESQYSSAESCLGIGSWSVQGNNLTLEYNSSRCESNREIAGTYQIDGTWLMGKKNFYEVE